MVLTFSSSKVSLVSAVMTTMLMMMMMPDAAAVPLHSHGERNVSLLLDLNVLESSRNLRFLGNDSISPWVYDISTDHSLFPPHHSEARCLLEGCLNSNGEEDQNLRSRPIQYQGLVLRRVKSKEAGHGYHYKLESRLLTVGCTCVRPHVHIQQ